jgi:hypothetical protein
VLSAVRKELRRIQAGLATGTLGPRPDSPIGAALGSVVDNYLRSWWVAREGGRHGRREAGRQGGREGGREEGREGGGGGGGGGEGGREGM